MNEFELRAIVAAVMTIQHVEWGSETAWQQAGRFLEKLEKYRPPKQAIVVPLEEPRRGPGRPRNGAA